MNPSGSSLDSSMTCDSRLAASGRPSAGVPTSEHVAGKLSWLAILCGFALPLEAVVIPGFPVRISLAVAAPAMVGTLLAISGHVRIDPSSRRVLEAFFASLFGMFTVAYAAALAAPIGWASADISRGWLRAPTHVGQFGLFCFAAIGLVLLSQGPRHRRALLGGFCWTVIAVSIYAIADFLFRHLLGTSLPQIGNDSVTADRRLASFTLLGTVIPRVSGSAGEPKGFAWILIVYLVIWIVLRRDLPLRLARLPGALLPFGALLTTFSTSGWIMALVVLPLAARTSRRPAVGRWRLRAIFALLVFVLVAVPALFLLHDQSRSPTESGPFSVVQERLGPDRFDRPLSNFRMASEFIWERPLGWGLGNYHRPVERETGVPTLGYAYPGILLYVGVEGGVAGLLLALVALGVIGRFLWLRRRRYGCAPHLSAGSLIILAWLIRTTEVGGFDPLLALGLALVLATTGEEREKDRPSLPHALDERPTSVVSAG